MDSFSRPSADSLNRWLASLPDQRADLVYLAAIPLWLESSILLELYGDREQAEEALRTLEQHLLLTRVGPNRAAMRSEARRYLLRAGWQGKVPEYPTINRRLADFCIQQLDQTAQPADRFRWARAVTYHLLVAGEEQGWDWLAQLYDDAEGRGLIGTAAQVLEPLRLLRPILDSEDRATLAYYQARAALFAGQQRKAECLFTAVTAVGQSAALVGVAYRGLGRALAARQRWSNALAHLYASERILRRAEDRFSLALTRLNIGDVFQEMAEFNGGIVPPEPPPGGVRGLFYLPWHLYRLAGHMLQWWIFINVGFNYQNWAAARLMLTAARAYRRAERDLILESAPHALYQVRLGLARVYSKVGMHRRAERMLDELETWDYVQASDYREAQIIFRRADMAEAAGQYSRAKVLFQQVEAVFSAYHQRLGLASVYDHLGSIAAHNEEPENALSAYRKAAELYAETGRQLSKTKVLNEISRISGWSLQDDDPVREYLARFSHRIARFYRRLAIATLPVSLPLGLLFPLVLLFILSQIEFVLIRGLPGVSIASFMLLIFLALASVWVFQFIYLFTGIAASFVLPIGNLARDRPMRFILDDDGLTSVEDSRIVSGTLMEWENILFVRAVDYRLRLRRIELWSHLDIFGRSKRWSIPALTTGYADLVLDLKRRLPEAEWRDTPFKLFFHWANYVVLLVLIPGGIISQQILEIGAFEPDSPAEWSRTDVSGILITAFIMALLLFPLLTFWRLVLFQWQLWHNTPPNFPRPRPSALLHLLAILWTGLTILYVSFLLRVLLR